MKREVESQSGIPNSDCSYNGLNNHLDSKLKSDQIELLALLSDLWMSRWLIISFFLVFATSSVFYALSLPNEYRASALLAPSSQGSAGGLAKVAGQLGGLASLAGINIGGGDSGNDVIAMELIRSWSFLEKFIENNSIEAEVFAVKGWNRKTDELIYDSDIYDPINKLWVRPVDLDRQRKSRPSSWELYDTLKDRIAVSQDKNTGLITLSVTHYSPQIAKKWVDKIVEAINAHIKARDKLEASKSISYLNKKVQETNISEMQSVFYQLIEEQTKTLMLAEISEEYALKTVSEAKAPEEKVGPNRALICIVITFLGSVLGVVVVIVKNYIGRNYVE